MQRYVLILIVIVFYSTLLNAQDISQPELIKNAIIVELESCLFIGDAAINYERNLISKNNNSFLLNLRGGFGRYISSGLGGTEKGLGLKMSLNPLMGNGKSYFEASFGLGLGYVNYCLMNFGCPDWRVWPIVNIGYRHQYKTIFRFYVGTLGIGISLGFKLS